MGYLYVVLLFLLPCITHGRVWNLMNEWNNASPSASPWQYGYRSGSSVNYLTINRPYVSRSWWTITNTGFPVPGLFCADTYCGAHPSISSRAVLRWTNIYGNGNFHIDFSAAPGDRGNTIIYTNLGTTIYINPSVSTVPQKIQKTVYLALNEFVEFQLDAAGDQDFDTTMWDLTISTSAMNPTGAGYTTSCFGKTDGSLKIEAINGGIAPYTFSLNGNTYKGTGEFNGLSSRTYTVYVKDATGTVETVSIFVPQPEVVTFSETLQHDVYGADSSSVSLSGSGGSGKGYQYSMNGQPFTSSPFDKLHAGDYSFQAKDDQGCLSAVKHFTLLYKAVLQQTD